MCVYFVLVLVFIFFFFKQKTAYEMRISDWSSDVCSSDLHQRAAEPAVGREADQPVCPHRVRGLLDPVEAEVDALALTVLPDGFVDLRRPLRSAELGLHVEETGHSLDRHLRIQLDRTTEEREIILRSLTQGPLN